MTRSAFYKFNLSVIPTLGIMVHLLIAGALSVLAYSAAAEEPEWMKQQPIIDQFAWESVSPFYHATVGDIRKYKKLELEKTEPFSDPSVPGGNAVRHIFTFDGVIVSGFEVTDNKFFLEYVDVTDPKFKFPAGLSIGSTSKQLIQYFGKPQKRTQQMIQYQGETERLVFHLHQDRVHRVELLIYVD